MDLAAKACRACEGWEKPFTKEDAQKYMKHVRNWKLVKHTIEKKYEFNNFKEALNFINKVGEIAEEEGHHPDIYLYGWNKVKFILSTHAIKGLSENDFILAAKIDKSIKQSTFKYA